MTSEHMNINHVDLIKNTIDPLPVNTTQGKENELLSEEGDEILSDSESDKEPEVVENIKLNKINTLYELDISEESLLNTDFLYTYCIDLIKTNQYDPKVITWMIENKEKLFNKGLTDQMIKWILKKDKYYKANNIINSMTYRLAKFGRLAPKSDLVRKLNDEDNEENFKFYEEDSFIEVEDEDENYRNDYLMIKDVSGFYSEERIGYMIRKKRKERKENHQKNKNKMKLKDKMLGNKRRLGNGNVNVNGNEDSVFSSMKENCGSGGIKIYSSLKELLNEYKSKQEELKENKKQKLLLVRSVIYNQRRKIRPSDKEKYFNFEITSEEISSFINEDLDVTNLLIAYEIKKYNKESKWSTIYKGIHKFIKDNNSKESKEGGKRESEERNKDNEDNEKEKNTLKEVKVLDEDKYKEKIHGFYRRIQEFKVIYEDMNRLTSSNSEILKKYINGIVDVRDPIKFAKTRIQICMNSLKMNVLGQGKFWEIYEKLEEEGRKVRKENEVEDEEKRSFTENDFKEDVYSHFEKSKSNKKVLLGNQKTRNEENLNEPLNMVINLIEESNFSMINSGNNENASGLSVSEEKDKGKVRKYYNSKKPILSNYFYKKDYDEKDFMIDLSIN